MSILAAVAGVGVFAVESLEGRRAEREGSRLVEWLKSVRREAMVGGQRYEIAVQAAGPGGPTVCVRIQTPVFQGRGDLLAGGCRSLEFALLLPRWLCLPRHTHFGEGSFATCSCGLAGRDRRGTPPMKHPDDELSGYGLEETGFALLEILVALVVAGGLLSVLLPAMTFSSERLSLVEQQSAARRLAAARLEVLQTLRPEEATPSEE